MPYIWSGEVTPIRSTLLLLSEKAHWAYVPHQSFLAPVATSLAFINSRSFPPEVFPLLDPGASLTAY